MSLIILFVFSFQNATSCTIILDYQAIVFNLITTELCVVFWVGWPGSFITTPAA